MINLIVGTVCGAHITACLFSYFARIDNDSFYSDSWVLKCVTLETLANAPSQRFLLFGEKLIHTAAADYSSSSLSTRQLVGLALVMIYILLGTGWWMPIGLPNM